eukprot:305151_1
MTWNDDGNSTELTTHLQSQCPQMKKNARVKTQSRERKYHQGAKGGVYYETSGGNKVYLKDEETKAVILQKLRKTPDVIEQKGRKYYQGAKGGIYYKNAAGNKVYLKSKEINELKCKVHSVKSRQNDTSDEKVDDASKGKAQSSANATGYDYKGRALYQGAKGGIYYETSGGNKVYLAEEEIKTLITQKVRQNSDVIKQKGRKYYEGAKGGIYYETSGGNKVYLAEEEIKTLITQKVRQNSDVIKQKEGNIMKEQRVEY